MSHTLLQYLFPQIYVPFVGAVPTAVFWVVLFLCRNEIGLWQAAVWGVIWIGLFVAAIALRINPPFYFPAQVLMAIIIAIVGSYKARTN